MKVIVHSFLFLFFVFEHGYSQTNALISGKMTNAGSVKTIKIHVNHRYIDGEASIYSSQILDDGFFSIALEIKEPQIVRMVYSGKEAFIYLEPNDGLQIYCNANFHQNSFRFKGRTALNNALLAQFLWENPIETDPFKLIQFRQETYWYSVDQNMNQFMQQNNPVTFQRQMELRKEKALNMLNEYDRKYEGQLTPAFKGFLSTDIFYNWAYHLLLYGNVYKNRYGITPDFFQFTELIPLQSNYLSNYWYQEYLKAFFDFSYQTKISGAYPYAGQYELASKVLKGRSLAYLQTELIQKALLKNQMQEIQPYYLSYLQETPYTEFDKKIVDAYEKVMKYNAGALAPDFSLTNDAGKSIALRQFRGRVVYLNFWASWCRPCIQKMNNLQPLIEEMEGQGIVFLNVSIDERKESWLESVKQWGFGGIHLRAEGGVQSETAKKYDVQAIPKYFIINKHGNFEAKPQSRNLDALKAVLQRCVAEN